MQHLQQQHHLFSYFPSLSFIRLLMLLERGKLSRKSVSPAVSIWPPLDPPIIVEQGTLPLLRNHKSLGGRVIIDHLITPRRLWGQSKVTS